MCCRITDATLQASRRGCQPCTHAPVSAGRRGHRRACRQARGSLQGKMAGDCRGAHERGGLTYTGIGLPHAQSTCTATSAKHTHHPTQQLATHRRRPPPRCPRRQTRRCPHACAAPPPGTPAAPPEPWRSRGSGREERRRLGQRPGHARACLACHQGHLLGPLRSRECAGAAQIVPTSTGLHAHATLAQALSMTDPNCPPAAPWAPPAAPGPPPAAAR